ncbi:MAG: restriction endonuclease [Lachnospiraceae bacterium]|nr:restriction endonuclease [Lachnospiraceae bacterium]
MSVPKYFEMYKSFLRGLEDGQEHPYIDVKNQVIQDFNLSDTDIAELLPSERQTIFSNRIGWCRTYLKKAGLIESPSRAHFVITDEGKRILNTVDVITNDTLRAFPSFMEFIGGEANSGQVTITTNNSDETPQETLERVHSELNKVLKDELLTRIHQNSPDFFEKLVVELMEKMGYGRGEVTQRSRDEGIDGIVYQDKLGFDVIYVQAKRFDVDKTVGRPELQRFGGALPEKNAKGLFVTTAKFSADAKQYADERHIILIDGQKLAQLMIEHDFGVSTEYVYKVKKIDSDIFEDEE